MKNLSLGNGTKLVQVFLRSALSWPGNLIEQVTPDIATETRWLRSPYVGVVNFKVLKQISYKASLSMT